MHCKNCKSSLLDASGYCNICGAKVIRNRLTLKNLLEHFSEEFLNYDNKFFKTFIHLFTKPEAVIGSYINGTRKKYVNVISYFAIAITLSGLQIYIMKKYGVDLDILIDDNAVIAAQQEQLNSKIFNLISEYQSILMMLYIPLYALMAKLIFLKDKTYNYTELLVVFMYAQAQFSIVAVILTITVVPLGVPMAIFGLIILPLQVGYFAFCLKRVYGLNFAEIILKALIFFIVLGVVMVVLAVITGVLMYQTGMFEEVIDAQKKLKEAKGS